VGGPLRCQRGTGWMSMPEGVIAGWCSRHSPAGIHGHPSHSNGSGGDPLDPPPPSHLSAEGPRDRAVGAGGVRGGGGGAPAAAAAPHEGAAGPRRGPRPRARPLTCVGGQRHDRVMGEACPFLHLPKLSCTPSQPHQRRQRDQGTALGGLCVLQLCPARSPFGPWSADLPPPRPGGSSRKARARVRAGDLGPAPWPQAQLRGVAEDRPPAPGPGPADSQQALPRAARRKGGGGGGRQRLDLETPKTPSSLHDQLSNPSSTGNSPQGQSTQAQVCESPITDSSPHVYASG